MLYIHCRIIRPWILSPIVSLMRNARCSPRHLLHGAGAASLGRSLCSQHSLPLTPRTHTLLWCPGRARESSTRDGALVQQLIDSVDVYIVRVRDTVAVLRMRQRLRFVQVMCELVCGFVYVGE